MTLQGAHVAGWITFSAADKDGVTVAQCQVLMRAQDPLNGAGNVRHSSAFGRASVHTATAPLRKRK